MSQEKTTLEVIAPTVEEAIQNGAQQLGLKPEMLEVEVLDSGSRGIFGLGSRQARIRLMVKSIEPQKNEKENVKVQPAPVESKPKLEMDQKERSGTRSKKDDLDEQTIELARNVVEELLVKMKVQATVTAERVEPTDENDHPLVLVEIQGSDLSILIGRRSETLNAIQYVASLIVSKEAGKWVPMLIDVQGYRERRERQLRVLARRMAEQVVQSGRRQSLEPMPANERRVIHLELRNHPYVLTESVGEEPNRKVTILLKNTK
jgi:spoIIIJ-associated protein